LGQTQGSTKSKEAPAQTPGDCRARASEVGAERNYSELEGTPKRLLRSRKPPTGGWIKCEAEGKHLPAGKQWAGRGLFILYFYYKYYI